MLYCYLGPGRLAVLERWLPNTVTILDSFHCTKVLHVCAVISPCAVLLMLVSSSATMQHGHPEIPSRVFVGRLPATIRKEDLTEHFEKYGTLRDVYIPQPFRGFAFITFLTGEEAEMVIREQHVIKGESWACVPDTHTHTHTHMHIKCSIQPLRMYPPILQATLSM